MRLTRTPAPDDAERRLFNRYPTGLDAELVVVGGCWHGKLVDLSIGGACVVALPEAIAALEVGQELALRLSALGHDGELPAIVRRKAADRVHIAFVDDVEGEHRLALFMLGAVPVPPTGEDNSAQPELR